MWNHAPGVFCSLTMVSTLWRHGPRMLEDIKAKQLEWPRFTAHQMSDLIAYLKARK